MSAQEQNETLFVASRCLCQQASEEKQTEKHGQT